MPAETAPEAAARRIVTRVAAVKEVEPTALPPLQETVDVDALGTFLAGEFSGTCAFTYAGCEVRAHGYGRIRVSRTLTDAVADTDGQPRQRRRN